MPVRSPYPDVDIPAVSLPEFLFGDDLGGHATLPAFVDGVSGYSVTFAELHEQVLRIAGALAERGIGHGDGDVVALFAPNSPAWAAAFHGVLRANAVLTSVNALYTAGELAAQLADSRARMILTVAALLDRAAARRQRGRARRRRDRGAGRRRRIRLAARPAGVHHRATGPDSRP